MLIVEQEDFHGDFFGISGGQFLDIHQEAAVAVDVDDQVIGSSDFGAEGRRQAEPHGAQATTGDPGAGLIEVEELGGPHLVLADTCGDDGAMEQASVPQQFPQPADGILGQYGILSVRNTQRIAGSPLVDLPPPLGVTPPGDQVRIRLLLQHGVEVRQRTFDVPVDRDMSVLILVNFALVDVDVHNLAMLGEFRKFPRDAIVEPHPEGQQQVGIVDGVVGIDGTVHAQHMQAEVMVGGEITQPMKRQSDRNAGQFGKLPQFGGGIGMGNPTSCIDERLSALPQSLENRFQLLAAGPTERPVSG